MRNPLQLILTDVIPCDGFLYEGALRRGVSVTYYRLELPTGTVGLVDCRFGCPPLLVNEWVSNTRDAVERMRELAVPHVRQWRLAQEGGE